MSVTAAGVRKGSAGGGGVAWGRKDLLGLHGLTRGELVCLLSRARAYAPVANDPSTRTGDLAGRLVATLFFEDSTRTRMSFTLAAARLGAEVVDLSASSSSVKKGESLVDTARVAEAMGVSALVVRARHAGVPEMIARAVKCPVINAGDGKHEHPTQGLLDVYTMAEALGRIGGGQEHRDRRADLGGAGGPFDLSGLTAAIVGDVANSRVARSAIAGVTGLGGKVVCVGPAGFVPRALEGAGCEVCGDFDEALARADVVMMLRIQFERQDGTEARSREGTKAEAGRMPEGAGAGRVIPSVREYREFFGLTAERAARMKPGAIVMHPGPMNRGLEIDGEVADGERSVILRQVANGVAARMGVLGVVVGGIG